MVGGTPTAESATDPQAKMFDGLNAWRGGFSNKKSKGIRSNFPLDVYTWGADLKSIGKYFACVEERFREHFRSLLIYSYTTNNKMLIKCYVVHVSTKYQFMQCCVHVQTYKP